VMRDVYSVIQRTRRSGGRFDGREPRPPEFATFEDGYHTACIVDAALESHRRGAVWTKVREYVMA
jgi:hypothetical protein